MQTVKILVSVCEEADKICRDFIWGSSQTRHRCHLVSWEKFVGLRMGGSEFSISWSSK